MEKLQKGTNTPATGVASTYGSEESRHGVGEDQAKHTSTSAEVTHHGAAASHPDHEGHMQIRGTANSDFQPVTSPVCRRCGLASYCEPVSL